MIKRTKSGNILRINLPKNINTNQKIFISKSKRDLRQNKTYSLNNKKHLKTKEDLIKVNLNQYNNIPKVYYTLTSNIINKENTNSKNEKSIKINDISEDIILRKKLLNSKNMKNKMKKFEKQKLCIYQKKSKISLLLNNINYNNCQKEKSLFNKNIIEKNNNSDILGKSKIIFKQKSQRNFRIKNNYFLKNDAYNSKSHSIDNLNKNVINIKTDNNKEKVNYIKVNMKNKAQKKTLNNNKIYNINKNENKKQKKEEYNIFLDKEYQRRFMQKPNETNNKNDIVNSDKQKKYNTILIKKKIYKLNDINNLLSSTISSTSTSHSSISNNRDWVYRLYNEEINKKKLENKIVTLLRKSILVNADLEKKKKHIKPMHKENSKYDEYGNYKNFNIDNNFINKLILSGKKNEQNKKRTNLCLNNEINNNKNKIKERKMIYKKKKKKNFCIYNDELINEEDEDKELDKEEN